MKLILVTYLLIAEVLCYVLASKATDTQSLDGEAFDDSKFNVTLPSSGINRRRDVVYYYSRPHRLSSSVYSGRQSHKERIRQQTKANRPFHQYGPPNNSGQSHGQLNSNFHQDIPSPIRNAEFTPESPIASQNTQPFGQHTANYLPPQNQKLPASNSPQLFSNVNHDFPRQNQLHLQQEQRFQQQQQHEQQQYEQFQQQQLAIQQQLRQQQQFEQQQQQQPSADNQNGFGQDFNIPNQNFAQNEFGQISDAALFLTQNAQAISNLYQASAPNNQEFEPLNQQQNHLNLDVQTNQDELSQDTLNQSPSFASNNFNSQDTLQKIQSLEKDRLIAQLQQELSNRESAAEHFNYQQSQGYVQQQPPAGYPGFYAPAAQPAATTPQPPVSSTPHAIPAPQQPSQSGVGSTHVRTVLAAPEGLRPTIVNSGYPQYGGFVPTFVSQGFVPSVPNYGTTLFPAVPVKPVETAPTHFTIPIPAIQEQKPLHPPPTSVPAFSRPPTLAVSVTPSQRPVVTPAQTPVVGTVQTPIARPEPIPLLPAAVPVHPTYGYHPTYVYKPVKPVYKPVYPVYLYPSLAYKPGHRVIAHPWNYAPSYRTQGSWR